MTALNLQNRHGDVVEVPAFSATEAKNGFGHVLDVAAAQGIVAITKHDQPKAVVLSISEYDALVAARSDTLGELTDRFDELLATLQAPSARRAMEDAFSASPTELGAAAVKAARKTAINAGPGGRGQAKLTASRPVRRAARG